MAAVGSHVIRVNVCLRSWLVVKVMGQCTHVLMHRQVKGHDTQSRHTPEVLGL